jgi:lipid II:glycine glycyltransferase (peptidoglycan interpeptide bridge formation enzyme)
MISYKKHTVAIAELYFGETLSAVGVDVIRYCQRSEPTPGVRQPPYRTILIDLRGDVEEILGRIERGTRYEIRRADKDNLALGAEFPCRRDLLGRFCDAHDNAASAKQRPRLDRRPLQAACAAGVLDVSWAGTGNGTILAWHCHHQLRSHAVLSYSVSTHRLSSDPAFRQLVGRANRRLHWEDITRLKSQGVETLDLGGWYEGSEDQELLKINAFKEELGGRIVEVYNSMQARTWKGRLAMRLLSAKRGLLTRS